MGQAQPGMHSGAQGKRAAYRLSQRAASVCRATDGLQLAHGLQARVGAEAAGWYLEVGHANVGEVGAAHF